MYGKIKNQKLPTTRNFVSYNTAYGYTVSEVVGKVTATPLQSYITYIGGRPTR